MPHSNVSFASLALAAPLQQALADEGYSQPTPIQALAIPPVLEGRDVLGCAQTGTGKTAAFALPILSRLLAEPVDKQRREHVRPRVLVLSPTRELASQIGDSFATYGRHTGLSHTVIFGGVSQFHQVRALHRGVHILVATPGRLIDLMQQKLVVLSEVRTFVLDEADRMLDMGFIKPIRQIAAALPSQRQTLLFSATMPREIMHLADALLKDPVKVTVAPPPAAKALIEQKLYHVGQRQKPALLKHLLDDDAVTRAVVFIRTKHGANKLCTLLHRAGVDAVAIHGNKSQGQRERALDAFRDGNARVLVATDVAARGLDVDGVSHVFNFDLPMEPEAYVHRIGRTGRAGATGVAIAFCDVEERDLLRQIERVLGKHIPTLETPADVLASAAATTPPGGHFEQPRAGERFHGGRGPSRGPARQGRGVGGGGHGGHSGGHSQPRPASRGWHQGDDHAPHAPTGPQVHRDAREPQASSHSKAHAPRPHSGKPHPNQAHSNSAHPKPAHPNQALPGQSRANNPHSDKPHASRPHASKPHANKPHAGKPNGPRPHGGNGHGQRAERTRPEGGHGGGAKQGNGRPSSGGDFRSARGPRKLRPR